MAEPARPVPLVYAFLGGGSAFGGPLDFDYFRCMSKTIFLSAYFIVQTFSTLLGVEAFDATMKEGYTLVDVRTEEEFARGALPGAQNISVTSLAFGVDILKLDKDQPVMIYCQKGGRSARAAVIMKTLGFSKIYELEGGYSAWEATKD